MKKGYEVTAMNATCTRCDHELLSMSRDHVRCSFCGAQWFYRDDEWALDLDSIKPVVIYDYSRARS